MDPALGIMSPFRDEVKALDGVLDNAIEAITGSSKVGMDWSRGGAAHNAVAPESVPLAVSLPGGVGASSKLCSLCSKRSTPYDIPADGLYICADCIAQQRQSARPELFPAGTFKCCPEATDKGEGGVVRCAGCQCWYHARCVNIVDPALEAYVALSTTRWYCPDPACSEAVLLARQRRH